MSALIFLSAAGFVNATVLQMPRSYYAMAEDGVLPRVFLRVQPRTQVSMAGLLLFGVTMLVPAFLLGSFEKLLNYVIFTDMLTLVVVASTLFALRKRGEGRDRRVPDPGLPRPARALRPRALRRRGARGSHRAAPRAGGDGDPPHGVAAVPRSGEG